MLYYCKNVNVFCPTVGLVRGIYKSLPTELHVTRLVIDVLNINIPCNHTENMCHVHYGNIAVLESVWNFFSAKTVVKTVRFMG